MKTIDTTLILAYVGVLLGLIPFLYTLDNDLYEITQALEECNSIHSDSIDSYKNIVALNAQVNSNIQKYEGFFTEKSSQLSIIDAKIMDLENRINGKKLFISELSINDQKSIKELLQKRNELSEKEKINLSVINDFDSLQKVKSSLSDYNLFMSGQNETLKINSSAK